MKKIIFILIIVVALAGSVVFGYMALSKKTPARQAQTTSKNRTATNKSSSGSSGASSVLPQGNSLNFEKLEDFNPNRSLFPYPQVVSSEVGANSISLAP